MSETPEQKTAKQWDQCIENTLIKTSTGLIGGMTTSFLLFRSPVSRAAVTALFAGIGAGISFMENKDVFEKKQ